ncbi:MAG: glycerol-3-phosphate dehydrogenase [Alphaproteobacteria bacterium]|nr:glycerol-3-phosphate dehydrogenase [Alphaproteobacteria bacterium]
MSERVRDLIVVGGGVNGTGIARDAAGRGLDVLLVEQDDLASATSSASTKLIHGGLRYLEYYEFRLVREALTEREVVLKAAPHIVWPLTFVLPHTPDQRPAWMLRAGLFLYDHLGGRDRLPGSRAVDLHGPFGRGLEPRFGKGFTYSDCWVDDARLVALNAVGARDKGAEILTRTRCLAARRADGLWTVELEGRGPVHARALVNAAGPWVEQFRRKGLGANAGPTVRLVKGSHIVVPKRHDGDHAFMLQNDDKRVIFVIPYETDFSLIGTTDIAVDGPPGPVSISSEETEYLCRAANRFLDLKADPGQVAWSYSGVRPLFDDGSDDPSAVTRDYVLEVEDQDGRAPALSIYGGKITTYRRLAEHALEKLAPYFPAMGRAWTEAAPLPGGDMAGADFEAFLDGLRRRFPELRPGLVKRLARRHGTRVDRMLEGVRGEADLGTRFGSDLYRREVDWLMAEEWARRAEDVMWRRTKAGLRLTPAQRAALAEYMNARA